MAALEHINFHPLKEDNSLELKHEKIESESKLDSKRHSKLDSKLDSNPKVTDTKKQDKSAKTAKRTKQAKGSRKLKRARKDDAEGSDTVFLGKRNVEKWFSVRARANFITNVKFVGWLLELADADINERADTTYSRDDSYFPAADMNESTDIETTEEPSAEEKPISVKTCLPNIFTSIQQQSESATSTLDIKNEPIDFMDKTVDFESPSLSVRKQTESGAAVVKKKKRKRKSSTPKRRTVVRNKSSKEDYDLMDLENNDDVEHRDYGVRRMKREGLLWYACKLCGINSILYKTLKATKKHINQIHIPEDKQRKFICEHCGHCCYSREQLYCHKKVHHRNLRFYCDQCDYITNLHGNLKKHRQKVHEKELVERKHLCDQCSYRSYSSTLLKRHILSQHTYKGQPRFMCTWEGCSQGFTRSEHLKLHMYRHTGEKPRKCPHCDYSTIQHATLQYHIKRHHPGKLYPYKQKGKLPKTAIHIPLIEVSVGQDPQLPLEQQDIQQHYQQNQQQQQQQQQEHTVPMLIPQQAIPVQLQADVEAQQYQQWPMFM